MRTALIVAAAGRGARMGEKINKLYLPLGGRPLLWRTLATCLAAGCFEQRIVVVAPGEEELLRREVLWPYFPGQPVIVVTGGEERQDSVYAGLLATDRACDLVCIHDGARPLVHTELVVRAVQLAAEQGSAVAAVPLKDTVKRTDNSGMVLETLPRHQLRLVQTPQVFRRDWLLTAYSCARAEGLVATDDAALVERCGYPVRLVTGDYENIKVTTPEDLALAEIILGRRGDARRDWL